MAGLRMPWQVQVSNPLEDQLREDTYAAAGQNQLQRGFMAGRLGGDANYLAAQEASLRAANQDAEAQALRDQIGGLQRRASIYAPAEQDVTQLGWSPGRIADWTAGQVGQGAASMLDPMAAAGAVGVAARFVPGPMGALARTAQLAAPFLINQRQQAGETYNAMVEDPALMARTTPQERMLTANVTGAAQGALDTALPAMAGARLAGKGLTGVIKGLRPAPAVGLEMLGEGATEAAQQRMQQAALGHLNPDRDTSGDANDLINAFAGGAAGSGPISAGSHVAYRANQALDSAAGKVMERVGKAADAGSGVAKTAQNLFGQGKKKLEGISLDTGETITSALKSAGDAVGRTKQAFDDAELLQPAPFGMPEGLTPDRQDEWLKAVTDRDEKRLARVSELLAARADDPKAQEFLQAINAPAAGPDQYQAKIQAVDDAADYLRGDMAVARTARAAGRAAARAAELAKRGFSTAKDAVAGAKAGFAAGRKLSAEGTSFETLPYEQWLTGRDQMRREMTDDERSARADAERSPGQGGRSFASANLLTTRTGTDSSRATAAARKQRAVQQGAGVSNGAWGDNADDDSHVWARKDAARREAVAAQEAARKEAVTRDAPVADVTAKYLSDTASKRQPRVRDVRALAREMAFELTSLDAGFDYKAPGQGAVRAVAGEGKGKFASRAKAARAAETPDMLPTARLNRLAEKFVDLYGDSALQEWENVRGIQAKRGIDTPKLDYVGQQIQQRVQDPGGALLQQRREHEQLASDLVSMISPEAESKLLDQGINLRDGDGRDRLVRMIQSFANGDNVQSPVAMRKQLDSLFGRDAVSDMLERATGESFREEQQLGAEDAAELGGPELTGEDGEGETRKIAANSWEARMAEKAMNRDPGALKYTFKNNKTHYVYGARPALKDGMEFFHKDDTAKIFNDKNEAVLDADGKPATQSLRDLALKKEHESNGPNFGAKLVSARAFMKEHGLGDDAIMNRANVPTELLQRASAVDAGGELTADARKATAELTKHLDKWKDEHFVIRTERIAPAHDTTMDSVEANLFALEGRKAHANARRLMNEAQEAGKNKAAVEKAYYAELDKRNVLFFPREDGADVPIQAGQLAGWGMKRLSQNGVEHEEYQRDEAYLAGLQEGIGALLASNKTLNEMPYRFSPAGKREDFSDGIPPSLRLATGRYVALADKLEDARQEAETKRWRGEQARDEELRQQGRERGRKEHELDDYVEYRKEQARQNEVAREHQRDLGDRSGLDYERLAQSDRNERVRSVDAEGMPVRLADEPSTLSASQAATVLGRQARAKRVSAAERAALPRRFEASLEGHTDELQAALTKDGRAKPAWQQKVDERRAKEEGKAPPAPEVAGKEAGKPQSGQFGGRKFNAQGADQGSGALEQALNAAYFAAEDAIGYLEHKGRLFAAKRLEKQFFAAFNIRRDEATGEKLIDGEPDIAAVARLVRDNDLESAAHWFEQYKTFSGRKFNTQAIALHNELGRPGFGAAHNSPIRHEGKFDWRKHLGKGEGAWVYGAGTYLSTADNVHRYYKKQFTAEIQGGRFLTYVSRSQDVRDYLHDLAESLRADGVTRPQDVKQAVIDGLREQMREYDEGSSEKEAYADAFFRAKDLPPSDFELGDGKKSPTYEVTVDIAPERIMDWNAPLSDQPASIRFRALKAIKEQAIEGGLELHGEALYRELAQKLGDMPKASEYLQSLGILGHSYASAERNKAEPNYVIYDDSKIHTNFVSFNRERLVNKIATDEEVQQARDYINKVLGGRVKAEFGDIEVTMPDGTNVKMSGEYIDADKVIRLATSAGPGVLSVAYHEAMHGLWADLGKMPEVRQLLTNVTDNPAILNRINALLAKSPLAQAQLGDAEERVAYAYQFWAAGMLDVGRTASGFFAKIQKFLRRVFGLVTDDERAAAIFQAFHDGKLAEPSAAGIAINDILGQGRWPEKARKKFDAQLQTLVRYTFPSHTVLAGSESESARKVAKLLFNPPGSDEAGEGMLNAQKRWTERFINEVADTLHGMNDYDLRKVEDYLQGGVKDLSSIPFAPHREAVDRIRKMFDRFHKYAEEGGLNLGRVENYYPRVWDLQVLHDRKADFIKMLLSPKYAPVLEKALAAARVREEHGDTAVPTTPEEMAERLWASLADKAGVEDKLDASREDGVLTPYFQSSEERQFTWLDDADIKDFMEKNLIRRLTQYFRQGVRAVEYTRRFGVGGERLKEMLDPKAVVDKGKGVVILPGIIETELLSAAPKNDKGEPDKAWVKRRMTSIREAIGAMEGTLGKDISPAWRKATSWAMVYQNLRLLPLALFSAVIDPLGMMARGGTADDAYKGFVRGMRDVVRGWKAMVTGLPETDQRDEMERLAEMLGTVGSQHMLDSMGQAYTSAYLDDSARRVNNAMFVGNGMEAWNRAMRVQATGAAVRFIEQHAKGVDPLNSERWLRELGLYGNVPLDENGRLIVRVSDLLSASGGKMSEADVKAAREWMDKVHGAIARWVDGAILAPNSAQRPGWASDPHYGFLFHLKQFTYSFQQTLLRRAVREAGYGNLGPVAALSWGIPMMITSDIVKGLLQGGGELPAYMKSWNLGDWLVHGWQRAGGAGVGQLGIDASHDPATLLGPTVEQITDAVKDPAGQTLTRAVPLNPLLKGAITNLGD